MSPSLSVDHGAAVAAQEGGARALLAAEAQRPVEQAVDEPLEADGHLEHAPAEVGGDAVDDRAGDERLADGGVVRPVARAAEEVADAHREVVVGVQQPGARRDDPVAVGVGVVGEGDVELVGEIAQLGHRVRRRAVHADLAVPVERHEAEGRVDLVVGDRQVQAVALGDRRPVGDARAAERVDAEAQPAVADRREVDDGGQVVDVGRDVVVAMHACSRSCVRLTSRSPPSSSALASRWIQPVTSVSAGPPWGGLYFTPPSWGGLCDGVTTMPSARAAWRRRGCG